MARQRQPAPGRALTSMFVGALAFVIAVWLLALTLLTLWLIRAVF